MDNRELIFRPIFGKTQSVAYTGTAGTITNPLPTDCTAVWVWTTSDAYIKVGSSPTATSTDFPLMAYVPVVIPVHTTSLQSANGVKVSAIQISAGGTLYACPI